tara:strand:+ start:13329 stop:14177 length:849 start_codon:yes stop_codon:yes gene_type:complete
MIIKIDAREKKVIPLCKEFIEKHSIKDITVEVVGLPLGDMIITDNDGCEKIMIERKSLPDLASSICDGRYSEQSHRLQNYPIHNHNIIYLIEGDITKFVPKFGRINKQAIYSSIFGLQYYKGFSLYNSKSQFETAEYLVRIADKLGRDSKKPDFKGEYYKNSTESEEQNENENKKLNEEKNQTRYSEVIKKNKKDNITKENIGEILLMQIPGVSNTSAVTIIKKFGTLMKLIIAIQKDGEKCLKEITYQTKTGKTRHISSTCCSNIVKFLLDDEEQVLFIET